MSWRIMFKSQAQIKYNNPIMEILDIFHKKKDVIWIWDNIRVGKLKQNLSKYLLKQHAA